MPVHIPGLLPYAVNKAIAFLVGLAALTSASLAQSVTPMRGEPRSVAESFAIRILVGNPYPQKQTFAVNVYDDKFYPVDANISLPQVTIPGMGTRSVVVVVPFDGMTMRRIRICAEGIFGTDGGSKLRTQVCGKYQATHVGP